jgi:hypothetical protein
MGFVRSNDSGACRETVAHWIQNDEKSIDMPVP